MWPTNLEQFSALAQGKGAADGDAGADGIVDRLLRHLCETQSQ